VNEWSNDAPTPPLHEKAAWRPGRKLKWAISLVLVFHLAAIIIAPAAAGPPSQLIESGWKFFGPYLQFLYLDHGHRFFAPEPGPSTLVSYVAEREDGTIVSGRIPDRSIVPRLLYHRYFMLTEHMNQAPEPLQQIWYRSYAEHVGHKYGAARVSLTKQTHWLPTMEMVRDGMKLDDPASYEEQPLGVFPCKP
jgi:hypothetical protein